MRLKYISNNLKLKGSKVLDLGCGGGLLCEAMTNSGANVVGIDASLKTIEIAKKHADEKNLKITENNYGGLSVKCETDGLFIVDYLPRFYQLQPHSLGFNAIILLLSLIHI